MPLAITLLPIASNVKNFIVISSFSIIEKVIILSVEVRK